MKHKLIDNLEILELENVASRVHELSDSGCRFITMTCCNNKDGSFDIFYSFDLKFRIINIKATVNQDTVIPSISSIFLAAAFAENEIMELFGLKFKDLLVDYGGRFMITENAPNEPFGGGLILVKKDDGTNAG